MKFCDFCDNSDNTNTYVDEITFLFGYQTCDKCSKKEIGKTFIKKWYTDNNSLPFNYFLSNCPNDHPLSENNCFKIQRTNGKFENNWFLDHEKPIKYIINDNEDLLIPLYKGGYDEIDDKRGVNKNEYLSELCRFNSQLNESEIINIFKTLFEKFKE